LSEARAGFYIAGPSPAWRYRDTESLTGGKAFASLIQNISFYVKALKQAPNPSRR